MNETQKVQATYEHPVYLREASGKLVIGEDDAPIIMHKVGDPVFGADGITPIYKSVEVVEPVGLPELDDDLIEILGRPCFQCINLANALRLKGQDIRYKAEDEQAAVLHFTLRHYLKDKEKWRDNCRAELASNFVQTNGRLAFGNVDHIGTACALITVTVLGQDTDKVKYEAFNIKGIFKKPYTLEEGIFFDDSAMTAQAIVKNLKAGEVFDTALLPEGWMTYDQFFAKLEEQHKI